MYRWHATVAGAVALGAVALAGCGGTGPSAPGQAGENHGSRAVTPSAPASGSAADVGLTSDPAPFTGDVVTLTVQARAAPGDTQPVRLASASLELGDGTKAAVSGPCAGSALPSPEQGLLVRHVYHQAAKVTARVTAATVCGQAAQPNLTGSSAVLQVLPAAPAASASWPQCTKSQVEITAVNQGAALGHAGVLFTLRNMAAAGCRLYGFPGMQMLSSSGQPLPTTVSRVTSGSYLISKIVPHWVALEPGATGSFDLEYSDVPVGTQANQPSAQACPAATQAEVTLPGAADNSVIPVNMAPCGGQVLVSPVVPAAQWVGH